MTLFCQDEATTPNRGQGGDPTAMVPPHGLRVCCHWGVVGLGLHFNFSELLVFSLREMRQKRKKNPSDGNIVKIP